MKEQAIKVPLDMAIDVFKIITKENIKHEVLQVDENRSLLMISLGSEKNLIRHKDAIENIRQLLNDYNDYRFSENEELDWKDI